jgi:hypothetical protein
MLFVSALNVVPDKARGDVIELARSLRDDVTRHRALRKLRKLSP